jgi:hypothetical protein
MRSLRSWGMVSAGGGGVREAFAPPREAADLALTGVLAGSS